MNRIALLEDHARLADLILEALAAAGIATDAFQTLSAASTALRDVNYGALIIDRGLPDGDGLDLVKRLRLSGVDTPCLILTARDALHDRIDGLESGADDYLTKPFQMEELVARAKALLRRPAAMRSAAPTHGDLLLLPEEARVQCGSQSAMLAPAELQILLCLVNQAGRAVRRTALEAAAWGQLEVVTPNALDVALHRLRRKLQAVGSGLHIINIRSHGYALQVRPSAP